MYRYNRPKKIHSTDNPLSNIKYFIMIDFITTWFEVTQYEYKRSTTIYNLVENIWIMRYAWTEKITYDQE